MKVETAVKTTLAVIVALMVTFILFLGLHWLTISINYQPPTVTQLPLPPQSDYNERLEVFKVMENAKILGEGK